MDHENSEWPWWRTFRAIHPPKVVAVLAILWTLSGFVDQAVARVSSNAIRDWWEDHSAWNFSSSWFWVCGLALWILVLIFGAIREIHRRDRVWHIAQTDLAATLTGDAREMSERAQRDLDSAVRLHNSAQRAFERIPILEERLRRALEERREVLAEHNRSIGGFPLEALHSGWISERRWRQAATELELLILDGETLQRSILDQGAQDRAWIERALRFCDRAFAGEFHAIVRRGATSLGDGPLPIRTRALISVLIAARENFTVAELDPTYSGG